MSCAARDLFASTHVHRLLQALLDLPSRPISIIRSSPTTDGKRLAKRDLAPDPRGTARRRRRRAALAADLLRGQVPSGFRWREA